MVSLDTGSEGASVVPWFVVCFFLVESCVWYLIILWHFVWLKWKPSALRVFWIYKCDNLYQELVGASNFKIL